MKIDFLKISALILFAHLSSGCESSGSGVPVDLPRIDIDCTRTECMNASGTYEVTIEITKSGCAANQIDFEFFAVGVANVTCVNGSGCTGAVSSYRDKQGQATTQILSGMYYICGWLDLDPGSKNANDAFSESYQLLTSSTFTLTDWGANNYFIRQRPPQP